MVSTIKDLSYLRQEVKFLASFSYILKRRTNIVIGVIVMLVVIILVLLNSSMEVICLGATITTCMCYTFAFILGSYMPNCYHAKITCLILQKDKEIQELEEELKLHSWFLSQNLTISTTIEGNHYLANLWVNLEYITECIDTLKKERKYLIGLENIGIT